MYFQSTARNIEFEYPKEADRHPVQRTFVCSGSRHQVVSRANDYRVHAAANRNIR